MLYHYFGDKKGLFEATVRNILDDKRRMMDAAPPKLEEILPYMLEFMHGDLEWMRMAQWEALTYGDHEVLAEKERRAGLAQGVERVQRMQRDDGVLSEERPDLVLLAFMSLCSYPMLMPQVTRMVTGMTPGSAEFRAEYGRVLGGLARSLQAASRPR
jgi:AcrR family transcriptional regulator